MNLSKYLLKYHCQILKVLDSVFKKLIYYISQVLHNILNKPEFNLSRYFNKRLFSNFNAL